MSSAARNRLKNELFHIKVNTTGQDIRYNHSVMRSKEPIKAECQTSGTNEN